MKKLWCVLVFLAILLTAIPALAQSVEDLDLTAMTDEQLQTGLHEGKGKCGKKEKRGWRGCPCRRRKN